MLLEAKLSPMNLGDQRFAIEIAEPEETRIQGRYRKQSANPEALLPACSSLDQNSIRGTFSALGAYFDDGSTFSSKDGDSA